MIIAVMFAALIGILLVERLVMAIPSRWWRVILAIGFIAVMWSL
jgi:hypothetical protein